MTEKQKRPLYCGHRGAKGLVAENTIASFEKAIEIGADMVEFDVRRTADGVLAICHGKKIGRRSLAAMTYAEINEVAPQVPTLADVLRTCNGRIKVDIELKERDCEEDVIAAVREHIDDCADALVTSFFDDVVARVKEIDPKIRTGLLVGLRLPNRLKARLCGPFPFKRCARVGADVILPHYKLLKYGFINRAHKYGLPVYVWTINDPGMFRHLRACGVDAIITDYPDKALQIDAFTENLQKTMRVPTLTPTGEAE